MQIKSITQLGKECKLSEEQINEFRKTYYYSWSIGIIEGISICIFILLLMEMI